MNDTLRFTILGSLALGLFACGEQDVGSSSDDGARDAETASEGLEWRSCGTVRGRDVRCAELDVPLDHDAPDGPTLPIAINLVTANPAAPYRGKLFFNPGGPGASGKQAVIDLAAFGYFDAYAPGYDIVGFDPRGVADSGERSCGAPSEPPPVAAEMAPAEGSIGDYIAGLSFQASRCQTAWGPLYDKLGSNQVVRDLDLLRQALGQNLFNYIGVSYGTRLGALYAHEFPEHTGSIVLDASVSPQEDIVAHIRNRFAQVLQQHEDFFRDCESGELSCPDDPRRLFDDMMAAADELGVFDSVAQYWADDFSTASGRDELPVLLEMQASEPDSNWLLSLADSAGDYGVGLVANFSVNCADANTAPPSVEQLEALHEEFRAQSEVFAYQALMASACAGWPVASDPVPMPSALSANRVLVIGGTRDVLTPLSESQAMTDALGNATLLISDHYGHGATLWGDECVYDAVYGYLAQGTLPAEGATCP